MGQLKNNYIHMKHQFSNKVAQQSSTVYGLGLIGAIIYFIHTATSFWMGAFGIIKAIVWPAILVYKIFDYLKIP
jgi:phage-related protein